MPEPTVIEDASAECDACPHEAHVTAYVFARLSTGPLSLCAHHGSEAIPRLAELGATVIDLRHLIGHET